MESHAEPPCSPCWLRDDIRIILSIHFESEYEYVWVNFEDAAEAKLEELEQVKPVNHLKQAVFLVQGIH